MYDPSPALTHMRTHNDLRLAGALAGLVDLVLGGHDHEYELVPAGHAGPGSPAIVKAVYHNAIKS